MATTSDLPPGSVTYDYLVIGGGTAGCVVASRLAESLPECNILLVEGGSSDVGRNDLHDLKGMVGSWGGDTDYGYKSTPQLNGKLSLIHGLAEGNNQAAVLMMRNMTGNGHILHTRGKILGGCSNVNGCISFHPMEYDIKKWQECGAKGWTFEEFNRLFKKLRVDINPVHEKHQSPVDTKLIQATQAAYDLPRCDFFNDVILADGNLRPSAGFLSIAYNPDNGYRNSASMAYIHPILSGERRQPNLTVLTDAWAYRINFSGDTAVGASLKLKSGRHVRVRSHVETILCAGAIDSPRLLLLSGVGPRMELRDLGIPVVTDVPGVGENLMDHTETIIRWEM